MNQLYEDALTSRIKAELAKEIHDELGNTLAVISSKIKVAKLKLKNNDGLDPHFFDKAEDAANKLLNSTKDFIWTVGSSNDNPINLFYYLKDIGTELFDDSGVNFYANVVKQHKQPLRLSVQQSYQLVLLFKEAMTNIAKYAEATEIHFILTLGEHSMSLVLSDNGKGFDQKVKAISSYNSFGLKNMNYRAERIGATLSIDSKRHRGTTVSLSLPVHSMGGYANPSQGLISRQAS